MEELSKIAMGYYQASTDQLQKLARDFFGAMDHDGDGKIDLNEFMEFMKEEGHGQLTNPFLFNQLDLDGNGTLDFVEVMTLYYIIKSGRPFCKFCEKFIMSTYLTCVGCLEDPNRQPFYLCLDCYVRQKSDHTHDNLSRFLDNYSLLEYLTKLKYGEGLTSRSRPLETDSVSVPDKPLSGDNHSRDESLGQVPQKSTLVRDQPWWIQHAALDAPSKSGAPIIHNHMHIQNSYSYNHTSPRHVQQPNTSNAIIRNRDTPRIALGVLNAAVQIGLISAAGSCSIL